MDHAHCPFGRTTVDKIKSRSIHRYDARRGGEVRSAGVMWPTGSVTPVSGASRAYRCYRWGPRRCFLAGASRAADVVSALPMDSLTIHGAPLSTSRGLTRDPDGRPHWAETGRAHAGSAGTMTRAAVIAPQARPQTCCDRRQVRAADVETGPRPVEGSAGRDPCEDTRTGRVPCEDAGTGALGTAAPKRTAERGRTGRIGLSSSSASRWRCTVCTPSGTAGDGTGVRGHRCAGIETQPKRAPLTWQRTRARIGTAARRRSGGPSPGCWTSILAHDCAEMVARW
jgi:hypothetical protein